MNTFIERSFTKDGDMLVLLKGNGIFYIPSKKQTKQISYYCLTFLESVDDELLSLNSEYFSLKDKDVAYMAYFTRLKDKQNPTGLGSTLLDIEEEGCLG